MSIEVLPEIGQLDFSGIELERLKAVVPEKDVDEALQRIAKANREQKPVDPPRPAQKGDALKLDFVGSVDGVEFPGGKAEDYVLELGSGSFIPGFEDQLIGAEIGKPVDVKVKFPDDYGNKELAGKDAVFKCTVKEIHEFVDKPADDELAKKNNFENLEAMRKAVSDRIGQDYAQVSRSMIKRQLLDKLADTHKFAVPEGLVEGEFNAIWQRIEEAKKNGQKVEDDEEKMRKGVPRDRRAPRAPWPSAGRCRPLQLDRRHARGAQPGGDARGDALSRPGAPGAGVLRQECGAEGTAARADLRGEDGRLHPRARKGHREVGYPGGTARGRPQGGRGRREACSGAASRVGYYGDLIDPMVLNWATGTATFPS